MRLNLQLGSVGRVIDYCRETKSTDRDDKIVGGLACIAGDYALQRDRCRQVIDHISSCLVLAGALPFDPRDEIPEVMVVQLEKLKEVIR